MQFETEKDSAFCHNDWLCSSWRFTVGSGNICLLPKATLILLWWWGKICHISFMEVGALRNLRVQYRSVFLSVQSKYKGVWWCSRHLLNMIKNKWRKRFCPGRKFDSVNWTRWNNATLYILCPGGSADLHHQGPDSTSCQLAVLLCNSSIRSRSCSVGGKSWGFKTWAMHSGNYEQSADKSSCIFHLSLSPAF